MRDNTLSLTIWFSLHPVISSYPIHKIVQPVVFLPGTLCDERVFMPCWQYLDIPYQAYVPLQWAEDLSQMLALGADRLDYFDQPVHVVGFSMGGYIAALLAVQNPIKIASLTLIGNTCQALPDAKLIERKNLLQALQQGKYKGMSDAQILTMLHEQNTDRAAIIGIIREMEQDLGIATLASQMKATNQRKNLIPQLAKSTFTCHFVAGEHDQLASPSQLKATQQQIPDSTLEIIVAAGHMLPLEQPKLLADHLAKTLNQ
ncbi:MAG: alpha/beta hydrolase [Paraglaciecola sp.]|nr:alpha/beta hydrolase [Paraglaciecola sp.]